MLKKCDDCAHGSKHNNGVCCVQACKNGSYFTPAQKKKAPVTIDTHCDCCKHGSKNNGTGSLCSVDCHEHNDYAGYAPISVKYNILISKAVDAQTILDWYNTFIRLLKPLSADPKKTVDELVHRAKSGKIKISIKLPKTNSEGHYTSESLHQLRVAYKDTVSYWEQNTTRAAVQTLFCELQVFEMSFEELITELEFLEDSLISEHTYGERQKIETTVPTTTNKGETMQTDTVLNKETILKNIEDAILIRNSEENKRAIADSQTEYRSLVRAIFEWRLDGSKPEKAPEKTCYISRAYRVNDTYIHHLKTALNSVAGNLTAAQFVAILSNTIGANIYNYAEVICTLDTNQIYPDVNLS